jgi:PAS domain S-box-containing protein
MVAAHDRGGAFLFVSASAEALLGYTSNELLGHTLMDLTHEEDKRMVEAAWSRMLQRPNRPETLEYRMRRKSGSYAWFETKSQLVRAPNRGDEIICVSRDVTHRKRLEQSQLQMRERLQTMANASRVLIWVSDIDGHLTFCNTTLLKFIGSNVQDALAGSWTERIHTGDRARVVRTRKAEQRALQAYEHQYRLLHVDGTYHWIQEFAVPKFGHDSVFEGYVGTCFDITPLKEAEAALERRNEELTLLTIILDDYADHATITDVEGTVIFANKAAERVTGFSFEEMRAKKAGSAALWGGLMNKRFYSRLWTTVRKRKRPFLGVVKNHRKDGTVYAAEIRIHPVLNEREEITHFAAFEHEVPLDRVDPRDLA